MSRVESPSTVAESSYGVLVRLAFTIKEDCGELVQIDQILLLICHLPIG